MPSGYVAQMEAPGQLAPSLAEIERLARAAIAALPDPFAAHLDGVVLIVENFADEATLDAMGIESPFDLSGLYTGRHIGEARETGDPPATIHLYRRPILDEWCEGEDSLDYLVAHIVIHEVGHHMGLSDEDIDAIEGAGD